MFKQLPRHASLENLKKQAKQLFKSCQDGNQAARSRLQPLSKSADYGAATFYPSCPAAEKIHKAWARLEESAKESAQIRSGRQVAKFFRQAGIPSPTVET